MMWCNRVATLSVWCAAVGVNLLVPKIVPGQASAPSAISGGGSDSLQSPNSAVVDTMMLPGRQNFSAYQTPGTCLAAAINAERVTRRTVYDTAAYAPEHDTLPRVVIEIARRCDQQFAASAVPSTELINQMHLALIMGDDAQAQHMADRYVALFQDIGQRRWALYKVGRVYLDATPMRFAAAQKVVAQLDALGRPAALQGEALHRMLTEVGWRRNDVALVEREALATLKSDGEILPQDTTDNVAGGSGNQMLDLLLVELYRNPTGATQRTVQRARSVGYKRVDDFLGLMQMSRMNWAVQQIGQTPPPLTAAHWAGGEPSDHRWPVPGKVSIYLQGDPSMGIEYWAMWNRLTKKYGDAIQLTVMNSTHGYFRDGPPLTPAQETARLGQYYREDLHLPAIVAVDEAAVQQLPDGRRLLGPAPYEQDPYYRSSLIVTDTTGKIALLMPSGGLSEAVMDAWLARLVGVKESGRIP
jgi:hypothetical protein